MFEKIPHIVIDFLISALSFLSGWWLYHFLRKNVFPKGMSGPAFVHTMGNINALMIEQNKQIVKLSQSLTEAQQVIEELKVKCDLSDRKAKALTEEVERLIKIIQNVN